jgi:predicted ATP-binding protein involved in virulence
MLYDKINDIQDNNILLLLDEVEVYLHPNWQRQFLKLLINFLSSKYENKKFHIILATHSPFLLSDIPKSNVVFLGGDDEVRIERTFGANIHALLSDSFFMEDGLMGEFAKDKIEDIMDFLNDEKKIEEISTKEEHIKQVIESIGEDLLRRKLLFMYYEKLENKDLEKEKQQLLEKQEEIKKLIVTIEEKQNK